MGELPHSLKGEVGVLEKPREEGRERGLWGGLVYVGFASLCGSKLLEGRNFPCHIVLSSAQEFSAGQKMSWEWSL